MNLQLEALPECDLHSLKSCFNSEKDLYNSLKYAAFLQQGIFPKQRHFDRIFKESFVVYLPKEIVSGDFYWLAELDDLVYVAVGDCMGHGVPAALMSVLVYNLLDYAILNKRIKKTCKILKEIDKRFVESFSSVDQSQVYNNDWVDISLCCIDRRKKQIFFSGAHHKIYLASNDSFKAFRGTFKPVGSWQIDNENNFESVSICYNDGDTLYLGSDGFRDQIGGDEPTKYGSVRFRKFIQAMSSKPLSNQKVELEKEFLRWKGRCRQNDDICLMGLKL
ncbi:MAG: PP2C family protein-serine/threonine phosphatase [Bacteroidales bacterium]